MPTPLSFKGDKKPKKRKRAPDDASNALTRVKQDAEDEPTTTKSSPAIPEDEDDSWVSAETNADIAGPIIIALPTEPAACLSSDMNGKIFAIRVENMVEGNPSTAEPHDVRQVWVANKVAGTQSFSLKGHHGKYLGCDKFGVLSATTEAVGPEESWTLIPLPDAKGLFVLQSCREKFVKIQPGKDISSTAVRGDAEDITFESSVRIRMQARFRPRHKVAKEEKASQKISRKELEDAVGRRLDDDEAKKLKRARREGNYHEALLDMKVKGKHDKFA